MPEDVASPRNLSEDAAGDRTESRPVEPLTYVRNSGHWYLLAWCRRRRAGRSFRLDRVRGARLTKERTSPRDLDELFGPPPAGAAAIVLE